MTNNIKKKVVIFSLVFVIGALAGIFGYLNVKITTFEECENSWLARSVTVYDYAEYVPNAIEKKCTLWTGKSFEKKLESSDFGNNQVEKAITDYLLTQKHFSWKNKADSFNFCAIENLDSEKELFPLYIWVYCGEYIVEDGELKTVSGSSGPAKINYPNQLSFYDLNKFSYEVPGDGSHYAEDIKKIFPEDAQQKIFNFDRKPIIKKIENIALSNILSWESIKQAINNCEVQKVFQAHSKDVSATLKNGNKLWSIEPKIDDIIKIAVDVSSKCGKIMMGTE